MYIYIYIYVYSIERLYVMAHVCMCHSRAGLSTRRGGGPTLVLLGREEKELVASKIPSSTVLHATCRCNSNSCCWNIPTGETMPNIIYSNIWRRVPR